MDVYSKVHNKHVNGMFFKEVLDQALMTNQMHQMSKEKGILWDKTVSHGVPTTI